MKGMRDKAGKKELLRRTWREATLLIRNSKVFSDNEAQKQQNTGERKRRDARRDPPRGCADLTPTRDSSTGTREFKFKANEQRPQQTEVLGDGGGFRQGTHHRAQNATRPCLNKLTHFWFHLRHLSTRKEREARQDSRLSERRVHSGHPRQRTHVATCREIVTESMWMNCKELNKSTMKIHTLPLDAPKKFMDFRVASWKSFFVNGFKLRKVHHMLLSVCLGIFFIFR